MSAASRSPRQQLPEPSRDRMRRRDQRRIDEAASTRTAYQIGDDRDPWRRTINGRSQPAAARGAACCSARWSLEATAVTYPPSRPFQRLRPMVLKTILCAGAGDQRLRQTKRTPIPRYVELADLLRSRIARGNWPPGRQAADAGRRCRGVRRRARDGAPGDGPAGAEGLVLRQQGRGTFVAASAPATARWMRVETTLDALCRRLRRNEAAPAHVRSTASPRRR